MTDKEYEQKRCECWEEYCQTHPLCNTPVMRLNFNWTFDRAYVLGKQETKQEIKQETDAEDTVIQCWVARDGGGNLSLSIAKPARHHYSLSWISVCVNIPKHLFPDLTWESDPIEVELIIKRKKNG